MIQAIQSTIVVVNAFWSGILFSVGFIFAPFVFILAAREDDSIPNTGVAVELVGPLFRGCDLAGPFVVAALLVGLVWVRRRQQVPMGGRIYLSESVLVLAGLCTGINYWILTPKLAGIRASLVQQYGAFHLADTTDPLRASFTALHHWATILFVLTFICSLTSLVCCTRFGPPDHGSSS